MSLAVVEVLGIPFALPPSPFAPMGESISIGVDAMLSGFVFWEFERGSGVFQGVSN